MLKEKAARRGGDIFPVGEISEWSLWIKLPIYGGLPPQTLNGPMNAL